MRFKLGTVICINADDLVKSHLTKGKVYKVVEGKEFGDSVPCIWVRNDANKPNPYLADRFVEVKKETKS